VQPGSSSVLTYCFLHGRLRSPFPPTAAAMATFSIRAFIPPLRRRVLPLQPARRYAVQAAGAPLMEIFSGQQKWLQKERAAADKETSRGVDYLRDEVASRLCERVLVRPSVLQREAQLTSTGHQPPFPQSPRSRRQRLQSVPRIHAALGRCPRQRPAVEANRHHHRRRLFRSTFVPRCRFALQQRH
jgi:hypothetical protein